MGCFMVCWFVLGVVVGVGVVGVVGVGDGVMVGLGCVVGVGLLYVVSVSRFSVSSRGLVVMVCF